MSEDGASTVSSSSGSAFPLLDLNGLPSSDPNFTVTWRHIKYVVEFSFAHRAIGNLRCSDCSNRLRHANARRRKSNWPEDSEAKTHLERSQRPDAVRTIDGRDGSEVTHEVVRDRNLL